MIHALAQGQSLSGRGERQLLARVATGAVVPTLAVYERPRGVFPNVICPVGPTTPLMRKTASRAPSSVTWRWPNLITCGVNLSRQPSVDESNSVATTALCQIQRFVGARVDGTDRIAYAESRDSDTHR